MTRENWEFRRFYRSNGTGTASGSSGSAAGSGSSTETGTEKQPKIVPEGQKLNLPKLPDVDMPLGGAQED